MSYRSWRARPIPPKFLLALLVILLVALAVWLVGKVRSREPVINDFASCVKAGNPVLETYPEQCTYRGQSFFRPGQAPPNPFNKQ